MREIRPSGSEGREPETNRASLPLSRNWPQARSAREVILPPLRQFLAETEHEAVRTRNAPFRRNGNYLRQSVVINWHAAACSGYDRCLVHKDLLARKSRGPAVPFDVALQIALLRGLFWNYYLI